MERDYCEEYRTIYKKLGISVPDPGPNYDPNTYGKQLLPKYIHGTDVVYSASTTLNEMK